jgi:hypothetical protein
MPQILHQCVPYLFPTGQEKGNVTLRGGVFSNNSPPRPPVEVGMPQLEVEVHPQLSNNGYPSGWCAGGCWFRMAG